MVPQPSSTQWAKPVKHSAGAFPHRPVLWRPLPYLGVLSSLPPVPHRISTSTALQNRFGKPRRLVPASSAGGKSAQPARQRCVLCNLFGSCESLLHGDCPLQLTVRDSGPPRVCPSLRHHQIQFSCPFPPCRVPASLISESIAGNLIPFSRDSTRLQNKDCTTSKMDWY